MKYFYLFKMKMPGITDVMQYTVEDTNDVFFSAKKMSPFYKVH